MAAPLFDESTLFGAFATITATIFIAELTDKDALLILTLSTKIKPWTTFAAGSIAFAITSAIIVTVGYFLTSIVPVDWIKLAGGAIMIGYAFYEYFRTKNGEKEKQEIEQETSRISSTKNRTKTFLRSFLVIVAMLMVLDLSGDATEVLTIVFVSQFRNALLVFVSCVVALSAASAVESVIGNRLGKFLSYNRIRIFSFLVFLIVGTVVIATTVSSMI